MGKHSGKSEEEKTAEWFDSTWKKNYLAGRSKVVKEKTKSWARNKRT